MAAGHGSLTLLTNVSGGLTAGEITGNGTGNLSVSATQAQFNATLAANNGLVYLNGAGFSGTDTLTVRRPPTRTIQIRCRDQARPTLSCNFRLPIPSPGPAPVMGSIGATRTTGAPARRPDPVRMW